MPIYLATFVVNATAKKFGTVSKMRKSRLLVTVPKTGIIGRKYIN